MNVIPSQGRQSIESRVWALETEIMRLNRLVGGDNSHIAVAKSVNARLPNRYDGAVEVFARDITHTFLKKNLADLFGMLFDAQGRVHIVGDLIVDGHFVCNDLDSLENKEQKDTEARLLATLTEELVRMETLTQKYNSCGISGPDEWHEKWDDFHDPGE
jgi:hypothetical protein